MTNATHNEEVVAYCRTCGRPLTEAGKREVLGVIYCESCIAARMQGTMPHVGAAAAPPAGGIPAPPPTTVVVAAVPGAPSPALAALLGFIPGVGALYNGQYMKGFVHVLIFASLIWAADNVSEIFGLFIAIFIIYMAIEAYKTAKAKQMGLPPPEDPLGLSRIEAGDFSVRQVPVAPVVLIGMGILFLLHNIGYRMFAFGRLWPVILIALGAWMFYQRQREVEEG